MNKHKDRRKIKEAKRRKGCVFKSEGWCSKKGCWCYLVRNCKEVTK